MDIPLIDDKELARRTGIAVATWRKWRVTGKGPPYMKVGRLCRYRFAAVEAWLAQRERASTARRAGECP